MIPLRPLLIPAQEEYDWSDYPLYHSTFDDFESMATLDPHFWYHLSLGHLWGLTALGLADAQVNK